MDEQNNAVITLSPAVRDNAEVIANIVELTIGTVMTIASTETAKLISDGNLSRQFVEHTISKCLEENIKREVK